jgi:hypothetical protein
MSLEQDREERLNGLFLQYKAACPETDAGANFLPLMWQRIEARRNPVLQWVTMSRRALAGVLALCMILGVVMATALSNSQFYHSTYIEALDDDEAPEDLAAMHPVSIENVSNAAEKR